MKAKKLFHNANFIEDNVIEKHDSIAEWGKGIKQTSREHKASHSDASISSADNEIKDDVEEVLGQFLKDSIIFDSDADGDQKNALGFTPKKNNT